MMTTTIKALMTHVAPACSPSELSKNKISVIGAGTVGTTIAFVLIAQKLARELVLIDTEDALARGEMLDIQNASIYLDSPYISSSTDCASSCNSKIVVITAGAGEPVNETAQDAFKRNVDLYKSIIPQVVKHSPNCVLIIVTNPVDIMTYVAWKVSGFTPHRVIGTGTILESARFRHLLADRLGVWARNIHAYIIGEQGPNSIPVWSGVTLCGIHLRDVNTQLGNEKDPEDWKELFKQTIQSENEVSKLKKCSSWGISLGVARMVNAILHDTKECFPISTHIKGCRHGVDKDVFMSLPCILGCNGVLSIVRQQLSDEEKGQIQKSADKMYDIQRGLKLGDEK